MGGKFVTTRSPVWLSCWRSDVTAGAEKIFTDSRSSVFILLASHRLCPASGNDVQHFFHRWILFSRNAPGYSSKSKSTSAIFLLIFVCHGGIQEADELTAWLNVKLVYEIEKCNIVAGKIPVRKIKMMRIFKFIASYKCSWKKW